ncbi:MAG: AAA family ATPase [Patescibacteria group bacterium]
MSYYIIIRGPLGCGKSTVSKKLAERLGAEYFEVDRILDEHNLEKDIEDGYISQKSFIKANEIIAIQARSLLENGKKAIFDGNFCWKSQIDDLIKRLDFLYHVFTLRVPLEVCLERDRTREKSLGEDATRAVYKKSTEFDYGTVIDTTKPLDKVVDEIISHL